MGSQAYFLIRDNDHYSLYAFLASTGFIFISFIFYFGLTMVPIALPMFEPEQLADFYRKKEVEKFGVLKWEDQQNHPLPQDFADMLG